MIKAIETRYKGYRFRSRLEARWAVFFDALGVEWRYEPEGFDLGKELGYYLPDFYLPKFNAWAEVKPEIPDPESPEFKKLRAVVEGQSKKARGLLLAQVEPRVGASYGWDDLFPYREIRPGLKRPIRYEGYHLLCPVCKDNSVYLGRCRDIGNSVVVPAWCKGHYHKWSISLISRKGGPPAVIRVANIQERLPESLGLVLAAGDEGLLRAAVTRAQSARFEHGETPK